MKIGNLASQFLGDPTNEVSENRLAQELGHKLFFDPKMSSNEMVSCASCHQPAKAFTDGLKTSRAIGLSKRNAPSLIGASYSPWFYWDGRKDSQWSQALSPLEDPKEHGGNRMFFAKIIASDKSYRKSYEKVFGKMPEISNTKRFPNMTGPFEFKTNQRLWSQMDRLDQTTINRIFSNIGKALAAYQGLLVPGKSRFDQFAESLLVLDNHPPESNISIDEARGLRLFLGKANCTNCHNGPLFSNNAFHNTGLLSSPGRLPDKGRIGAAETAKKDPFNCLGSYSDDGDQCMELSFASYGKELVGAFRTPSLRNLKLTAPYGHAGQQTTLSEVLEHYNKAPDAMIGHNEAKPLDLWPWELWQLEAFLTTLDSPPSTEIKWLLPPKP